jgi:N-acetylmuramic acid 6-phosphate etherase
MIRLGKVYGNMMVDVQPTNAKLRRRALRILQHASGADTESARVALEATGYDVKTSLVMLLTGADVDEARRRLEAAGGLVQRASI